jgi:hypothetical protein
MKKKIQSFRMEAEARANLRAWGDPAFKKKLKSNPKEALQELGIQDIPKNVQIDVIEEKPNTWSLMLHSTPKNFDKMSESELKNIAAAGNCGGTCTHGCG